MSLKRKFNGTDPDRWKDPVAWDILTDDQRYIINSWYTQLDEDRRKEEKWKETRSWSASFFALIPLAVLWAYEAGNGEPSTMMLVGVGAAWLAYAVVFYVFRAIYERFNPMRTSVLFQVLQIIVALFASYCIAYLIFR